MLEKPAKSKKIKDSLFVVSFSYGKLSYNSNQRNSNFAFVVSFSKEKQ